MIKPKETTKTDYEKLYGGMSRDEDVLTDEEKAKLISETEEENIKHNDMG